MRNNLIVVIPFLPENLSKKMRIYFPGKRGGVALAYLWLAVRAKIELFAHSVFRILQIFKCFWWHFYLYSECVRVCLYLCFGGSPFIYVRDFFSLLFPRLRALSAIWGNHCENMPEVGLNGKWLSGNSRIISRVFTAAIGGIMSLDIPRSRCLLIVKKNNNFWTEIWKNI